MLVFENSIVIASV